MTTQQTDTVLLNQEVKSIPDQPCADGSLPVLTADAEPSCPKARPILFSAPMVLALLAGSKTQTRRIVKPQPHRGPVGAMVNLGGAEWAMDDGDLSGLWTCPYGAPGDLLWVREACWLFGRWIGQGVTATGRPKRTFALNGQQTRYENPGYHHTAHYGGTEGWSWRPGIHMPLWASRLTLGITDVRVERLQDISEGDALAEGIERRVVDTGYPGTPLQEAYFFSGGHDEGYNSAFHAYRALWDHINGPGSWDANPWVWAVSFKVHQANVGTVLAALAKSDSPQ